MKAFRNLVAGVALAGATLGMAAAPAAASDHHNWSGLYIGAHLGGAWSDVDWTFVQRTNPGFTDRGANCAPVAAPGCNFSHDMSGFLGGGHIGLQHQFGQIVLGVEGALSGLELDDQSVSTVAGADDVFSSDMRWLVAGTVKLGYAWQNWLAYVRGGYASANIRTSVVDTVGGNVGSASISETHSGWTVGGGLEYALTQNWIIGAEYNYYDLGSELHDRPSTDGGTLTDRISPDGLHSITARLSFKLGRHVRHEEPLK